MTDWTGRLCSGLEKVVFRPLRTRERCMTDTAQLMVLPFFIDDAPSVSPDKGLQLLPIP
jgi:hypothetical protein